ncbi:putative dihydroorotate dehydrogenase (quinone) [Helianthus annuus]|uniref:Dihydroorotate dehydrogenase (Quinone) n=1 Tax=Helianthus annuus TaxID=4232 RepID=A0A9K3HJ23_HELAN|nr:putative dihydroorotate dehydrogenase (quinone) [Helianthus annuus]KAJ0490513.1 putative dihydroorotate dehydrogenase (quinone) [Helianthus annuus]KAJ0494753.1 putative dihydroorotate dehydrogenase (quinone) [Helianthus annuus]KAJ0506430.1 putative dihydroorotate dehydrogenase (quinone) [Helianthus annuus]KAJ0676106.1 putative dihydroorotate dehydrogenase (quinone) [Helianthus annuus]
MGRLLTGATIGVVIAGGVYASMVDEASFGFWDDGHDVQQRMQVDSC